MNVKSWVFFLLCILMHHSNHLTLWKFLAAIFIFDLCEVLYYNSLCYMFLCYSIFSPLFIYWQLKDGGGLQEKWICSTSWNNDTCSEVWQHWPVQISVSDNTRSGRVYVWSSQLNIMLFCVPLTCWLIQIWWQKIVL